MPLLMIVPLLPLTRFLYSGPESTAADDAELFVLIGCLMGVVSGALTILGVILCLRRHRKLVAGEIIVVNNAKILDEQSHIVLVPALESHNTYVKNTETTVPAGSGCPQRNEPQTSQPSQQRRVSISSDYTESHYYTEIDEYFINKRIAKKQKKNCYEKKSFEEDAPVPENKINIEANVYDYAYGMHPHK